MNIEILADRKKAMGKNRNQWCGLLKAVRSEGTAVFLSREAKLLELMLHRWRDLVVTGGRERLKGGRGFFGEGGDRVLEDGCCGPRMRYWRAGDSASAAKNMRGMSCQSRSTTICVVGTLHQSGPGEQRELCVAFMRHFGAESHLLCG